jgi:hypothetical protein
VRSQSVLGVRQLHQRKRLLLLRTEMLSHSS